MDHDAAMVVGPAGIARGQAWLTGETETKEISKNKGFAGLKRPRDPRVSSRAKRPTEQPIGRSEFRQSDSVAVVTLAVKDFADRPKSQKEDKGLAAKKSSDKTQQKREQKPQEEKSSKKYLEKDLSNC
ncbi:hypothetical protein B0H11DRAFT_2189692 [Mycena galericulata]|nr:hypothetical protein B0H11DRAFT_2189692 [Mycena galericulata]